jgi:hypothetical protein
MSLFALVYDKKELKAALKIYIQKQATLLEQKILSSLTG